MSWRNGQWGRKDPFASLKESQLVSEERTIYGQGIKKEAGDVNTTIGVNIQNPHWFSWYSVTVSGTSYGKCPNTTPYYNSWSAKNKDLQSGATSVDNIVVKTIYDPCPVGYTVAPVNAFSNFTTNNWDTTNKGGVFSGCWFPAVGYRYENGVLNNVATDGRAWHAVPYKSNFPRGLLFNSGGANSTTSFYRCYGQSVRPVAEIEN